MRSSDIRRTFLSFYEELGHRVVPSSPLIPKDPTLLFTIAGMVPFKPYFLGLEPAPYPRATSVQKCFRVENVEDVGRNAKDCTFFEMLGNFSFGDYFKEQACAWAWEFITEVLRVDIARLWVTVYEHEENDESEKIWTNQIGVDPARVVRLPKEDNFWHMGVPGPCGPNTEIFMDRGPAYGPEGEHGPASVPERYEEIYNLVFMEFEQDEPFHVIGNLPQQGVDTGMGLERLSQLLQDVPTVFDTDLLLPIVAKAEEVTGARRDRGGAEKTLVEIVADHARSAAFLIADGVTPSNEGRGFVLRRVLRRAITFARRAGVQGRLLAPVATAAVDHFADVYPEVGRSREAVLEIVGREEDRFSATLDAGLGMLESALESATGKLSGDVAFKLHDTFGFPLDITRDVATEAGLEVDVEEFERLMDEQRNRSRGVTEQEKARAKKDIRIDAPPTNFLGYEALDTDSEIVAIIKGVEAVPAASEGDEVEIVLDRTPFYPEGGGQVGDRGRLDAGDASAEVTDTQAQGALVLHRARITSGELRVGQRLHAVVSTADRRGSERSHTATHVLHHTLRDTLGEHVRQMGSYVEPGRLRFDFSHFSAVDADTLVEIEETVNNRIAADDVVHAFETSYREAIERYNAVAFFEEKYGDVVRVVEVGDYSRELCGGTHVPHTGHVGFVKVLGEGSIGSNLRRVEALTGIDGLRWVNAKLRDAQVAADMIKVPADELLSGIERLLRTQKDLERTLAERERAGLATAVPELVAQAKDAGEAKLVVARRPEGVGVLRELATELRNRLGRSVVILGTADDGRANIVAAVSKDLGIDAREILRAAASSIGGGAGGKPDFATAGGRRANGLDEALRTAQKEAEGALG